MIKKNEFPQLMQMVVDKTLSVQICLPYIQYYIQTYGPLDENDILTKEFIKIFKQQGN